MSETVSDSPVHGVALTGVGVSPGVAGGPVHRKGDPPTLPAPRAVTDADDERRRAQAALQAVADDLHARAEASPPGPQRAIIDALALIAEDPVLSEGVDDAVAAGRDAAHAVDEAVAAQKEMLESLGGMLAERAADLGDLRDRALARLLGVPMPGVPQPGVPYVLIARDLAPVDTASLDPAQVLALVTDEGGPTSHTAILARSLGIPAVVACRGVLEIGDGTLVVVDGDRGDVSVGVDAAEIERVTAAAKERAARLARSSGPGRTADGHAVKLLCNIGSATDAAGVVRVDAEGVGLFRTEFLFLDKAQAPTLDEQHDTYSRVFAALGGRTVVVRTLDAGADKPLPFLGPDPSPNPALGVRGLRIDRMRPDVLDTQLRALASAARDTDAHVQVMAPMVATAGETAAFVERVRSHGLDVAGVMVEVPAAALRAADVFAAGADFVSIGTNDLSQYTMAADRQTGELADLLDAWQPALLQLVGLCGAAGAAAGKPVGICGEAASDPLLAPVLVGLGATSLSMSANSVAAVREALASVTRAQCREAAAVAVAAVSPAAARDAVRAVLGDMVA